MSTASQSPTSPLANFFADFFYLAGKSRAQSVVTNDGQISFREHAQRNLAEIVSALNAARLYVETCADDIEPNLAQDALAKLERAIALTTPHAA